MSARASTASPSACSGDRYSGVPKMTPAWVSASPRRLRARVTLAMPKSRILTKSRCAVALDEHDVVGLEIAVDDAGGVRVLERAQDLAHDLRARARGGSGPAAMPSDSDCAREELHHQEQRAVGGAAEVGDGDDVRVGEAAGGLGLALEAARELVLAAELGQQDLDREIAAHHHVLGAVDGAHAADADAADDAVALADDGADERIDHGRAAEGTEGVLQLDLGVASSAARHRQRPASARPGLPDDVRASAGVALGGWTTAMISRLGSSAACAARATSRR